MATALQPRARQLLKLYLITSQVSGYDTFDGAIVAAKSAAAARRMHPSGDNDRWKSSGGSWASEPRYVKAILLGTARSRIAEGVILGAFSAG